MNYEIKTKEYNEINVASVKYIGKYTDCGKYFNKIFSDIKFGASKEPPMLLCYDTEYKEDNANIEVCVIVNHKASAKVVELKTLPKVKALFTTHIGPYSTIPKAYNAILDYASKNNIEIDVPTREIYIKGPGMIFKGNENKYITEVMIPIK